ncbi:MAG: hypothetical protein ACRC6V_19005, partial [Bacteroidales bacterium]
MPTDINRGFDDGDLLRNIRQDILNPVTVKVKNLESKMGVVEPLAKGAFHTADPDYDNKRIVFHSENGDSTVVLDGMFREGSDLTVIDGSGKTENRVHEIKLTDSQMIRALSGEVELLYDWGKLVPDHQKDLQVGTLSDGQVPAKYLFFKGAKVVHTPGDITTIDVTTPVTPLTASIPGGSPPVITPVPITQIELEGQTTTSSISGDKLTIHLNQGGGIPTDQNFQGFFASLGDLESKVQNPIDGKSYAFAKDSTLGGQYYTPYFYVGGTWTELKQDPALTYFATGSSTNQGVFSIKPNPGISIDSSGQLNLDGLSTPPATHYFHGFFDTLDALKTEVPRPSINHSFAYTKHANGNWIGRQWKYSAATSMNDWVIVAPIGAISMVASPGASGVPSPVFGIYNNDQWTLDSNGLASLKPIDTKTTIQISDKDGTVEKGEVSIISFPKGKSMVSIGGTSKEELIINNPQRVIDYNATWESGHNGEDYRGNLFYDVTSKTWMGHNDPDAPGGVDVKWTRLMHRGMSDQVKDLVRRVPAKAPNVVGGVLGDSGYWHFNGVSFLEKENTNLPEEFREKCGGYITTTVQDADAPGISIPQNRIQSCTPDNEEGGTWVRRFVSTGSPGAETSWSKWVRTSFSQKDIEDHEKNPAAHKDVIKYYRIFALTGKCQSIFAQTAGESLGGFHADNGVPLADNYGYTDSEKDYLDVPYLGSYRVKGVISLSGYNEKDKKHPTGRWQLVFRRKDRNTSQYTVIGSNYYEHDDETKPYPTMSFLLENIELDRDQELVTNFTFSQKENLNTRHPDLYLVPSRSNLVLEDMTTRAGSAISNGMRLFFGNLDVIGDVGIK